MEHKRGYNEPIACAAYGKDGTLIAVANSIRGLQTGSKLYGRVEEDEDEAD